MEEDKGNGKLTGETAKPQFKYFIKIMFNDETTEYGFETNVPNAVLGYGLLEFGKKGVDNHIARVQQKKIVPGSGGIMNFARRLVK